MGRWLSTSSAKSPPQSVRLSVRYLTIFSEDGAILKYYARLHPKSHSCSHRGIDLVYCDPKFYSSVSRPPQSKRLGPLPIQRNEGLA